MSLQPYSVWTHVPLARTDTPYNFNIISLPYGVYAGSCHFLLSFELLPVFFFLSYQWDFKEMSVFSKLISTIFLILLIFHSKLPPLLSRVIPCFPFPTMLLSPQSLLLFISSFLPSFLLLPCVYCPEYNDFVALTTSILRLLISVLPKPPSPSRCYSVPLE